MKIEKIPTDKLIPYARNAKKHDAAQVSKLAGSIREFGFNNPVLVDKDNGIIAGHGRVMAAQQLGLAEVPCIRLGHLTDNQRKAYILADNRLAEVNSGWDEELLKLEIADIDWADIKGLSVDDFEFGEIDFKEEEDQEQGAENYSRKIEAPIYKPQGPKPSLPEMFDDSKTSKLCVAIEASNLSTEEKTFLTAAAHRHTVFRFDKIAEYYAHSDAATQRLFEDSALVIVDFDRAIEDGFVKMSERMKELVK